MNPQTFVFIGRSGAGKGTQAGLLEEYLKKEHAENPVFVLETGKAVRDFLSKDGYTNRLAKEVNVAGGLQPSFLAVWMWSHILIEKFTGNEHLIIDGTPRTYSEASVFSSAMKFYNRKPIIVFLSVARGWASDRLAERGRADDLDTDDVSRRQDWFETDVVPVVDYFKSDKDVDFFDVDGERSIQDIHEDIVKRLTR